MRCLITGGAGFVGSHLAAYCLKQGHTVQVLDDLSGGSRIFTDGCTYKFFYGSILDETILTKAMAGVDAVFHLAACASETAAQASPAACEEINVEGTEKVLEAAAKAGVRRLVFASTAAVYGNGPPEPRNETLNLHPYGIYGRSKAKGEALCRQWEEQGGLSAVAARLFNVYGPHQGEAAVVSRFARQALEGKPMLIHGDGFQVRDFVHVEDVARGLLALADGQSLAGAFNIGTGKGMAVRDLADLIARLAGGRVSCLHEATASEGIRHSEASIDKIKALTAWHPTVTLLEGVRRLL